VLPESLESRVLKALRDRKVNKDHPENVARMVSLVTLRLRSRTSNSEALLLRVNL
jgi:hypothetical protein